MTQPVQSRHRGVETPRGSVGATHPRGLALIGLLTVLDGAWGAIVPFVGPLFGYRSHGQSAWQWSTLHGVLYLAPGAVAVLFGLIILSRARAVGRASVGFAGLVVVACGAWFVIGPALWPTFGTGEVFSPSSSATDAFINQLGYNLGVGVVLAALGGMALKALARDREVVVEGRDLAAGPYGGDRRPMEPVGREPVGGEPVGREPMGREPGGRDTYVGDRRPVEPTRHDREDVDPVVDEGTVGGRGRRRFSR